MGDYREVYADYEPAQMAAWARQAIVGLSVEQAQAYLARAYGERATQGRDPFEDCLIERVEILIDEMLVYEEAA